MVDLHEIYNSIIIREASDRHPKANKIKHIREVVLAKKSHKDKKDKRKKSK